MYDATYFYAESVLCPTKEWARSVKEEYDEKYTNAKWRVVKVQIKVFT